MLTSTLLNEHYLLIMDNHTLSSVSMANMTRVELAFPWGFESHANAVRDVSPG